MKKIPLDNDSVLFSKFNCSKKNKHIYINLISPAKCIYGNIIRAVVKGIDPVYNFFLHKQWNYIHL